MDMIFATGVLGGVLSVIGAALSECGGCPPYRSWKNWFLALGGLVLWTYAFADYHYQDGPVFFVFLESLIVVASALMMSSVSDRWSGVILGVAGLFFVFWSMAFFEGMETIWFILGLTGIALGYAFESGTVRRMLALTLGSVLVALFSYLSASWVFFWLNAFFALFSAYYLVGALMPKKSKTA